MNAGASRILCLRQDTRGGATGQPNRAQRNRAASNTIYIGAEFTYHVGCFQSRVWARRPALLRPDPTKHTHHAQSS
jgi:hypothetical protein